jgi:hypothetical protein
MVSADLTKVAFEPPPEERVELERRIEFESFGQHCLDDVFAPKKISPPPPASLSCAT